MIFSQTALSQKAVSTETGTLMAHGLLALVIACFSYKRRRATQAGFGIVLGTTLLISPWELGFSGVAVAVWNAKLVGFVIIVTIALELFRHRSGGVNE